jgi:hypothetical protein
MFDLERAISEWRRQLATGALAAPEVLDELESHLRDDVQQQVQSGAEAEQAFRAAVRNIGHAAGLEREFGKLGRETKTARRLKDAVLTLAGVPTQHPVTLMNTSNRLIEPSWATYIKGGAFLAPALCLWAFSTVFLFPRVQQICNDSGVPVPAGFRIMMAMMNLAKEHEFFLLICAALLLAWLEWRSGKWPRYRRASVGLVVFLVNSAVLILITAMFVLAMMTAPALFHAR